MNPFKSLIYSTLITDMKIIRAISVTQPNWYWWPILANRYQYISVSTGIDIYAISVTQPNRYWWPILATDIIIYRSISVLVYMQYRSLKLTDIGDRYWYTDINVYQWNLLLWYILYRRWLLTDIHLVTNRYWQFFFTDIDKYFSPISAISVNTKSNIGQK